MRLITILTFAATWMLHSVGGRAEGLPHDDPTLRAYQSRTSEFLNKCPTSALSHVDLSECLGEQIKYLRARVDAELKKSLIDAETPEMAGEIGGKTASQRGKEEKADILKSQAAWKAYSIATCGQVLRNYERNGGNGGDLGYANCAIRHLVQRYNELRSRN